MAKTRKPKKGGKVVEAERFVLRDRDGRHRATLGLSGDGGAALTFFDRDGHERASLSVGDGGVDLSFSGPAEGLSEAPPSQEAMVTVRTPAARPRGARRATLRVDKGGLAVLILFSADGAERAYLQVSPTGPVALRLLGPDEGPRVVLEVAPDGTPAAMLFDQSDEPVWRKP